MGLNHVDSVGEASLYVASPAGEPSAIANLAGDAMIQETAARGNSDFHVQLSQVQTHLQASLQSMQLQMIAYL